MIDDIVWSEIDEVYNLPEREKDDIDVEQMAERYGSGIEAARRRMKKMEKTGLYEYIDVKDTTCQNGKRKVLRKLKP